MLFHPVPSLVRAMEAEPGTTSESSVLTGQESQCAGAVFGHNSIQIKIFDGDSHSQDGWWHTAI